MLTLVASPGRVLALVSEARGAEQRFLSTLRDNGGRLVRMSSPAKRDSAPQLPSEWHIEFVWETKDGTIRDVIVDETQYQELAALVADARAARALSLHTDERSPLLQAVLPDSDGLLRARW